MRQSIATDADRATALRDDVERQVDKTLDWVRPQLVELVLAFRAWGVTPRAFLAFEQALFQLLLRLGRQLLEIVVNGLEGDGSLPPDDIIYGGLGYRRLRTKSRNAHVATMFGTICLWRFGYRFWEPWAKESCVFPLELELGLLAGVTPALADHLGRKLAEAGSTQHRVLQDLKQEHHVSMGVNRLRKLLALLHENIAEHRQAAQVQALLDAQAGAGRGTRRDHDPRLQVSFLGSGHHGDGDRVRSCGKEAHDDLLGVASRIGAGRDEQHDDRIIDGCVDAMERSAAGIGLHRRFGRQRKQLLRGDVAPDEPSANG
jgi:hypothetical protein